ncbi:acetylglutamate kinase [Loigolactobacillus bifermentans]|jgi:acetylglutamate kinase|uniref:Acetylglutamate kinase n=1 Tax=Loigolactobacillus bifermentans DSM 20003 TaxID=1423726 RepID=A0A0R1GL71_9LACO|nr:acetylglutamate kinase [Loigolactobacillus bifermentans]KRK32625.1 acetylglutamate kinase [Loigolactobacillus bifermentans DSM 20003]QGG60291.1 acetylglutamate kinase [Loigolactobacillus bifermentans]
MKETIVIKIGGHASDQLPVSFYQQLKKWREAGKQILIVHGGGPQISEWSSALGLSVEKKDGIRVTDEQTLAVTKAVLLGVVQPNICQALAHHGLPVIGLNTSDNDLLTGDYLDETVYGEVGQVQHINQDRLNELLADQIGVLAPLAETADGEWLNVNADVAAATIAAQLTASTLVLLTDVPGVLAAGKVVPQLDEAHAHELFVKNIIKSGMQPKIKAAFEALNQGVDKVWITDNIARPGTLLHESPIMESKEG